MVSIQALSTLTGLECLFLDRTQLGPNLQHFTAFSRLAHLALTTHGSQVGSGFWGFGVPGSRVSGWGLRFLGFWGFRL